MKTDQSKMVLRYYLPIENQEARFKQLVNFIERTGIRRIILFSSGFVEESAFFPLSYYKEHAQMLAKYIPALRLMGVEVGINMLNTMGHIFYSNDGEFNFTRAINQDGVASTGWACLRDENLHNYIKEQYSYYAALKPATMFLDDDVRHVKLNGLSCFCDEHIKAVSDRLKTNLTREDLRNALFSNYKINNEIKQAVMDVLKDDVDKITYIVEEAVHKISPDTRIGVMTVDFPTVTFDRDLSEFFVDSVSKKIDMIRVGMGFYREGEVKEIPSFFSNPMIQRNFINDKNVEIQPEVENDTYTSFYKSKTITDMQIIWCLTNGLQNMQLNIFEMLDAEINDFDSYTDLFANRMKYYNKITELVPLHSKSSGIGIFKSPRSLLHRRVKGGDALPELMYKNYWYQWIGLLGLPIGYDWEETPWLFLTGDDILGADCETVDSILKRGAILDNRAAECLVTMGYGQRIGIETISPMSREFAGERFTDEAENGKYKGCHNSYYFHSGLIGNTEVADITYSQGSRQISNIINHHHEKVANGVTLFENEKGERFCIIPMDNGLYQQFMNVNYKRKEQLENLFEWVARKRLSVISKHANTVVNINHFDDRNVITLFNLTSDGIDQIKIEYTVCGKLFYLDEKRLMQSILPHTDGKNLLLDKNIEALGTIILIDKK